MAFKIVGCGSYLPEKIVSNEDLSLLVDTNDEWISTRTGIKQRHIAADDEYSSHLAFMAAKQAINDANISASEIDLIIVCTSTPDNSFPSTANKLQKYLSQEYDIKHIPSFDIQAACAGFVYGLQIAANMINSGSYNTVLLVGAEKMSSLLDWSDRSTCVLFGDGAGAVILQRSTEDSKAGLLDSKIYSDGNFENILYTDGGVSSTGNSGKIRMQGAATFKNAVEKMSESVLEILVANNMTANDVDYFIPHQANIRIINSLAEKLQLDQNKLVTTIAEHANCSAASIPLALAELKKSKGLKAGDLILFTAFGAGLTWGSALLRW